MIRHLFLLGKEIIFLWVPSHIGIHGNTAVDEKAKGALNDPVSNVPIPHNDFKPSIRKYIFDRWQEHWNKQEDNKLFHIKPILGKFTCNSNNRKDQVVLTRCRIGHSRFTHEYHVKKEPPPECIPCDCKFTMKHVLLECSDFSDIRRKYFSVSTMRELFGSIPHGLILNFLREIGLYNKI